MYFLHKLLPAALAPAILAASTHALTGPDPTHRATHSPAVQLHSGALLELYHPPSRFETYGAGKDLPHSKRAAFNLRSAALAYATAQLTPSNGNGVAYKAGYTGDMSQNAFLVQTQDGVPYSNAVANIAFNSNNQVVAFGSSFVAPNYVYGNVPSITITAATAAAASALNATYTPGSPFSLEYYYTPAKSAVLVYVFEVQNAATGAWYLAFVDARTGTLVSSVDYVAQATYRALPLQEQDPTQGFETIVNPEDSLASPLGWVTNTTVTSGNNAISFKGTNAATTRASSTSPLTFNYAQDPAQAPTTQVNVDAARVNAFYVANSLHDLFYRYGFTEAAFNFQNSNQGLGGVQGDAISISVQDVSNVDTADFASPPDGTPGRLRMSIWDATNPNRDSALQNDLLIHELTHGLTNRLTGGGTGRCLKTSEGSALGEGWSDAMANWAAKNSSATPDFVIGAYVSDKPTGLRSYPYSTSLTTNPLLYSALQTRIDPHSSGEIWANMLYQLYAALVQAHGWSAIARTNPNGSEGNIVWLHLVVDALALQPCSPTFVNARDALLQADVTRYAGANKCIIWNAFALRGLGVGAVAYTDDFTVPVGC